MVEVNHDEIKKFKNRMKEISDSILFWALFTIWFLVIAIHFYYLSFTLSNNGVLNINKLMNTFKVKMIIDYLWVVILPFSFKIVSTKSMEPKSTPFLENTLLLV